MIISTKTDIGRVRSSNQDSFAAGELNNGVAWAVVCDGMGGANGGNIASKTAMKIISDKITSGYHEKMNDNTIKHLLVSAVDAANASVYSTAQKDEDLSGMGTTVVVVIINNDTVYLAHVGDSRIYIVDNDSINQITTDHSVVQMMLEKGEITLSEAKDHPKKNLITRALGVDENVRIDYSQENFNDDNIVILCTDGLTNFVDDKTIFDICKNNEKAIIADKLVEIANKNGGGDNITVVSVSN